MRRQERSRSCRAIGRSVGVAGLACSRYSSHNVNEMEEKPMASKTPRPTAREVSKEDTRDEASQHERIKPEEIRKIIERHRETFDELAK